MPTYRLASKGEHFASLTKIELDHEPAVGKILPGLLSPEGKPLRVGGFITRHPPMLEVYQIEKGWFPFDFRSVFEKEERALGSGLPINEREVGNA